MAHAILAGFDRHYRLFREAALQAKRHFESGEWPLIRSLTRARMEMYDRRVEEAVRGIVDRFPEAEVDEKLWPAIKLAFIGLLHEHRQPECAETFYNSVACQVLHRRYYRNEFIFWRPAVATEHLEGDEPAYRSYYPLQGGLRKNLKDILRSFDLVAPWENLRRDLRSLVHALRAHFPRPSRARPNLQIQVLGSLFFRNKAAYIVGRIMNGHRELPFAVPVLRNERGELYLDALLLGKEQLIVLFSFARAYFFVDMEVPAAYVSFLRMLMPDKPRAEMYMSVGLAKQGKTLFYRDLHYHLKHSSDNFVLAPGIPGMVMLVFMLPSFPYVFKVIRDHFAPPKEMDRQTVKDKYLLVKQHDRVGRMADTLEYSLVALPLERFSAEVLEELKAEAASSIEFEGDKIVIKHMYIERRMTPLNIYLDKADDKERDHAMLEYGSALKQLAAANIFAGDLLYKNFGVTRYGRVVFYDYDEIDYLTNCNFRRIPAPRNDEDEMSAEPWYPVAANDIFPEEFARFLLTEPKVRDRFMAHHADLLDADYWKATQERISEGHVEDIFPYPESIRFRNNGAITPIETKP